MAAYKIVEFPQATLKSRSTFGVLKVSYLR
jgi:hypothetical protein